MYYLKYKNYYTIIHYSKDDKLFYGEIEELKDFIAIGGKTLELIEESFKDSVDEYLDFCKDVGKIPEISKNCPILAEWPKTSIKVSEKIQTYMFSFTADN